MNTTLFNVTGDHPVLARPDKYRLDDQTAKNYAKELTELGFENVKITPSKPVFSSNAPLTFTGPIKIANLGLCQFNDCGKPAGLRATTLLAPGRSAEPMLVCDECLPKWLEPFASFKQALRRVIKRTISELKTDGVVSMGRANLRQIVHTPPGGPVGTNAAWAYTQMFNEVVDSLTGDDRAFIYDK
jgi:hypothetical protein